MKKLLLTLALIAPMINAESTDLLTSEVQTEITHEQIQFFAKFKALHSFCINEYTAIEQLFKDCAVIYSDTFDLLFALEQRGDAALKKQCRDHHDSLAPAVMNLNNLLGMVKDLNHKMVTFNTLIEGETNYPEATELLVGIAQEMHTIRLCLEAIKEYETGISQEVLKLAELN